MRTFADEPDMDRNGNCVFSIETLGLFVLGKKINAPFNVPGSRETIETFPVCGRYAHELDHLYRCVGTSWGLACHSLLGRTLVHYLKMLGEFDLEIELKHFRLADLIRQTRRNASSIEQSGINRNLIAGIYSLACANELRRAMLGFPPYCDSGVVVETANRVWGCTRDGDQPTNYVFPELRTKGRATQILSANTIIEALAILKESVFAVDNLEAKDSEVLLSAEKLNSQYVLALDIGRSRLRHLFDWEYQPIEIEAALNLALWSPILPASAKGISQFRWNDIEVGHRYLRILDWIRSQSRPLTSHSSLDEISRDTIYREFFENASRDLGWPSPFSLAEDWKNHLLKSVQGTRTDFDWWCFGEKRLRTSFALHLLSEFHDHPYYCWFTSKKFPALERPTFTFVQYDDTIELFSQHCEADGGTTSARIESFIFLGMQILLGLDRFTDNNERIISNHLAIVPQFFSSLPQCELVSRNLTLLLHQAKQ